MKTVVIESPYAGDIERNIRYARLAMLDSLHRGEAPFLSHLMYTQVWDDGNPSLREMGIRAGQAWARRAAKVAVYTDLGISSGMAGSIARYYDEGILMERRMLFTGKTSNLLQLGTITLDEALEREPQ